LSSRKDGNLTVDTFAEVEAARATMEREAAVVRRPSDWRWRPWTRGRNRRAEDMMLGGDGLAVFGCLSGCRMGDGFGGREGEGARTDRVGGEVRVGLTYQFHNSDQPHRRRLGR